MNGNLVLDAVNEAATTDNWASGESLPRRRNQSCVTTGENPEDHAREEGARGGEAARWRNCQVRAIQTNSCPATGWPPAQHGTSLIEGRMQGVGLDANEAVSVICLRCRQCDISSIGQVGREGSGTELAEELEPQQSSEAPKPMGSSKQPTDAVIQRNGNSAITVMRNRCMPD